MKATSTCPKCRSRKITKVKGRATSSHYLLYGKWMGVKNEKLDTYVCTRCGFSERYAQLSSKFLDWAKKNIIEIPEEDTDYV